MAYVSTSRDLARRFNLVREIFSLVSLVTMWPILARENFRIVSLERGGRRFMAAESFSRVAAKGCLPVRVFAIRRLCAKGMERPLNLSDSFLRVAAETVW